MDSQETSSSFRGRAGSSSTPPLLSLSSSALESAWVSQPSPCCAAAALAGALNALIPASEQRWTCERALGYLQRVMRARLERQTRRLQRFLDAFPSLERERLRVRALETAVSDALSSRYGLLLKGEKKLSKQVVQTVVEEQVTALRAAVADAEVALAYSRDDQRATWETTNQGGAVERSVAFDVDVGGDEARDATLRSELCEYFRLLNGLARLEWERPSTSSCGNDTVMEAVKLIGADNAGRQVLVEGRGALRASLLLAVTWGSSVESSDQSGVTFALSREGSSERRLDGWRVLCGAFSCSRTVLIYHMKNHYALIFALRERLAEGSEVGIEAGSVREVLTARKGQRPSVWLDWREMYDTLCSWRGYAVIAISTE